MIEKMKKASVIAVDRHRAAVVEQMRDAGVLHIHTMGIESETVDSLQAKRHTVERGLSIVSQAADNKGIELPSGRSAPGADDHERVVAQCRQLIDWSDEIRAQREERERLDRDALRLEVWGDFPLEEIRTLRERGIRISLHVASQKEFQKLDSRRLFTVNSVSGVIYFAQICLAGDRRIELDEVALPDRRLSELRSQISTISDRIAEIESSILSHVDETPLYRGVLHELDGAMEFERVRSGMQGEGALVYITGFVPESEVAALKTAATAGSWGLLLRDPDAADNVPTRVKNPKPVRIIQPVFDLLGTVPGYRELDISFVFLIFFTGFFAMIIGDAGYGLILLGLSLFGLFKNRGKPIPLGLVLLTLLSTATIVWGAITGTWFGYEGFARLPLLSWMVIPEVYSFNPQSAEVVQWFCFVIGTVHLCIAHGWTFLRNLNERPRIRALAQIGWLSMVLGLYHLVLTVVLRRAMPQYALYLIVAGFVAVLLFSMQEAGQNFFKGVLKGVASIITLSLDGVSAFSDIISYIRLFAVGLATVEIAASFNAMAAEMADGVLGMLAAVFVLFLGHTLNLAMAALAVIVHGVRLNMLEFSTHLGMEWSGVQYRPFQKSS